MALVLQVGGEGEGAADKSSVGERHNSAGWPILQAVVQEVAEGACKSQGCMVVAAHILVPVQNRDLAVMSNVPASMMVEVGLMMGAML
jgi:hypothetical protein